MTKLSNLSTYILSLLFFTNLELVLSSCQAKNPLSSNIKNNEIAQKKNMKNNLSNSQGSLANVFLRINNQGQEKYTTNNIEQNWQTLFTFSLYQQLGANRVALYACVDNSSNKPFVSLDSQCEGQTVDSQNILGYLQTTQDKNTQQLNRCQSKTNNRFYLSRDCGQDTTVQKLGFTPIPKNLRPLPAWFVENRVQGHTRLGKGVGRNWDDNARFNQVASSFKQLGANVYTRHIKSRAEDPWWPSNQPVTNSRPRLQGRTNKLTPLISDAKDNSMHMIGYYYIAFDNTVAQAHPEWACKRPSGEPLTRKARTNRETRSFVDITSGYREVILTRLKEAASMGVDGFYFDWIHMPKEGCFGSNLAKLYVQETNRPLPKNNNPNNPAFEHYIRFSADKVAETFAYWKSEVQSLYPDVVFLTSVTTVPALTSSFMSTDLIASTDSPKNEFYLATIPANNFRVFKENPNLAKPNDQARMALGYTLLRDSADGRPPHIWGSNFPNEEHALGFASAILSFGGIANHDVSESILLDTGKEKRNPNFVHTPKSALIEAYDLGKQVSPHLAYAQPMKWAGVLFSERQRNARGVNRLKAWREVLWPVVGAFQTFMEEGVPVSILNDRQLANGQLNDYEVLVITNRSELNPAQKKALVNFERNGGQVIVVKPDLARQWSKPATNAQAFQRFRKEIEPLLSSSPIQINTGDPNVYAVPYKDEISGRTVVALTNKFDWIQMRWKPSDVKQLNSAPSSVQNVQIEIRSLHVPTRAFEAVSNSALTPSKTSEGYSLQVPAFKHMSLVVVEDAS